MCHDNKPIYRVPRGRQVIQLPHWTDPHHTTQRSNRVADRFRSGHRSRHQYTAPNTPVKRSTVTGLWTCHKVPPRLSLDSESTSHSAHVTMLVQILYDSHSTMLSAWIDWTRRLKCLCITSTRAHKHAHRLMFNDYVLPFVQAPCISERSMQQY